MAKYLEMKAVSLEKQYLQRIVCTQVSNYPFDICKLGALFPDNYNKLKRAVKFCFSAVFNLDYYI